MVERQAVHRVDFGSFLRVFMERLGKLFYFVTDCPRLITLERDCLSGWRCSLLSQAWLMKIGDPRGGLVIPAEPIGVLPWD